MHSPGRRAAFKESKENQNTNKKNSRNETIQGASPESSMGTGGVTKACVPEFSGSWGDEEVETVQSHRFEWQASCD